MDGLIILDSDTRRPIIQTNFRNSPASYPLIHIDAFNHALDKSKASASGARPHVDPILYVHAPTSSERTNSVCCCVERHGLWFLAPVSVDVDPLYVFAFIETFINTLQEYLGDVTSTQLRDHFDIVYQLLEEMLDDGIPLTTETNTLRDIVLPPSLLNKILSVAGASGFTSSQPAPFSSPIPWRKAGLRYNNNEIFFDIVEELDAIVGRNGSPVSTQVWGKIQSNAKLSGTPDLVMSFSNPNIISDPSFHPCVRLGKYASHKVLSFVPPDGAFTLMEYRVDSPTTSLTAANSRTIPMSFKSTIDLFDEGGGSFEFTISSKLPASQPLEFVTMNLFLGSSVTSASCSVATGGGLGAGGVAPTNGSKEGSWSFDAKTQFLRWEIPALTASPRVLRGTFSSSSPRPRVGRAVNLTFRLPTSSFSGLKVEQMKMTKEMYKPYKGVRMSGIGRVEWRL